MGRRLTEIVDQIKRSRQQETVNWTGSGKGRNPERSRIRGSHRPVSRSLQSRQPWHDNWTEYGVLR